MNEYIDELKQPIIGNSFQIISQINKELQNNNIINLNYLLLKMSVLLSKDVSISKDELANIIITEASKLLVKYSDTFKEIYDNKKFSNVYLFINGYMNKVLKYYDDLMMTNQDNFAVRFAKHKDELEWLFMELYHNREGLEVLEREMAEAYNARSAELKALDKARPAGQLLVRELSALPR